MQNCLRPGLPCTFDDPQLHSNYFGKFLDSADKPEAPASSLFKYNYATVIDDDGIWAVEPKHKVSFIIFAVQILRNVENWQRCNTELNRPLL
jgi:hypothetical protein